MFSSLLYLFVISTNDFFRNNSDKIYLIKKNYSRIDRRPLYYKPQYK